VFFRRSYKAQYPGSPEVREKGIVKRKPDLMLVLLAVFGISMVVTLVLPISATRSVAAPASPLQAGLLAKSEVVFR
jgi:hypothetical protein